MNPVLGLHPKVAVQTGVGVLLAAVVTAVLHQCGGVNALLGAVAPVLIGGVGAYFTPSPPPKV